MNAQSNTYTARDFRTFSLFWDVECDPGQKREERWTYYLFYRHLQP